MTMAAMTWLAVALAGIGLAAQIPTAAPRLLFETAAGTFTVETYPVEAPLTVVHIVALAKAGFYDGLRVHRALPGFVVQFGDPQSRDESKRASWGRGPAAASGTQIGAAEISTKRKHLVGAVGVAHAGVPAKADSQIYITLDARPDLDGHYAVFGQVVDGIDVPGQLRVGDIIIRVSVQE